MTRLGPVGAGISLLVAAAVTVLGTLGFTASGSHASHHASIGLVAIDAQPSGNGPRTVGAIDDCVSAAVGEPVHIDIVVPSPGIPTDRGMAAYQFNIFYDPAIVWITADEATDMLLGQASRSAVIPIADPKPDYNGIYESWGVDFGPSGIEPAGASETGPGVIARITLLPKANGVSPLTLTNVLIIDAASDRISLDSVLSATINVGQPCPGQNLTPTPAPTPNPDGGPDEQVTPTPRPAPDSDVEPKQTATPTPAPTRDSNTAPGGSSHSPGSDTGQGQQPSSALSGSTPTPGPATAALAVAQPPSSDSARAVPTMGGPPPPAGTISAWFFFSGLIATLGGAGLLIGGTLAFRRQPRRDTSPHQN